jgi:uncharacterized low-complexity protein
MSEKKVMKPIALAVGAALAGSFAISGTVNAEGIDSPFQMSSLSIGYMLGEGEGSCGGDKKAEGEGSCGEGSCGDDKKGEGHDKEGEGSCGDDKEGEGSCGEDKDAEGSCGEGSCGSSI